jgi:outer membrane protein TolC
MRQYNIRAILLLLLAVEALGNVCDNVYSKQFSRVDALDEYICIALNNNFELKYLKKNSEAAKQKIHRAGTLDYPKIDLGFFPQAMELTNGKQIAQVSIMQMFSFPGANASLKNEAKIMSKMEDFRVQKFEDSLTVNIITRWYNLCMLKQKFQIFNEQKDILNQLEQLYITAYSAKNGTEAEQGNGISAVFSVKAELLENDFELEALQNELAAQTAEFNALLGRELNSEINVADSIEMLHLDFAKQNSKSTMIEMQEFEREIIFAQKQMNLKMSYPMFGLGLQYMLINKINNPMDKGMNGKDMFMIMGTIELPIWREKTNAAMQEAELLLQANELKLASMQNMLNAEKNAIKSSLQNTEKKISLLEKQTELLNSGYEISVQNFSVGRGNLVEVLLTKKQFLYYKLQMIEEIAIYNSMVANEFILWNTVRLSAK